LTLEQEPFLSVRSLSTDYPAGMELGMHRHSWHQLLFASSGAMTVSVPTSSWIVPTARAIFIPAGCPHSIRFWGAVAMRTLYLAPNFSRFPASDVPCSALGVTPLLRELILRIASLAGLDSRLPHHAHLLVLLEDEIDAAFSAAESSPLALPLPADPRAHSLAQAVLADPTSLDPLDDLVRRHGLSRRTLERRFHLETGLSFGLWRQKARLLAGIRHLAEGRSVTDTALDCGYSSVSAFIAAFKTTFGATPGKI
jgi:AraC-like DNA-binding protein